MWPNAAVSDSIADLLKLVLACPRRAPSPALPRQLTQLFAELAGTPARRQVKAIEEEIWMLWGEHADPGAAELMERAITAIGRKDHPQAEAALDTLVDAQPDWAEAWNKRATLLYILGRHDESMADIARTLALEPRHFGAICGFAQICLAQGRHVEALAAFETALGVHPHMESVRGAVETLGKGAGRRLN